MRLILSSSGVSGSSVMEAMVIGHLFFLDIVIEVRCNFPSGSEKQNTSKACEKVGARGSLFRGLSRAMEAERILVFSDKPICHLTS